MNPTLLGNRYRILGSLGSGGFGETFLAEDTHIPSGRRCVIKKLKPMAGDPNVYRMLRERFGREAAILEQLGEGHNQIPRLYAYFEEAGNFYLIQEFIEGQTLTQKLQSEGIQSESMVRSILLQLLPVLAFVHSQKIVHRDIKPDNIIFRKRDSLPVLIDFGSVKESINTALNSGNSGPSIVIGTPGFMPAEQTAGKPIYSTDLYALALTAIYLLTGRIPQQLDSDSRTGEIVWRQYAPNLSSSFAAVLDKAIRYHPQDRYSSAQEMLSALQSLAVGVGVTSPAVGIPVSERETVAVSPGAYGYAQPVPVSNKNNWLKALLVGGSLGLVAALAIAGIRSALQSPSPTATQPAAVVTPVTPTPAPTPPRPASTQRPVITPTPTPPAVVFSPTPAPTQSLPTEPPSPSPEIPQNHDFVKTPNENANSTNNNEVSQARVPGLPVGTSEAVIKQTFGSPTKVSDGLWENTEAMLYVVEPNQIDLGFIIDRNTRRLRQTEASFASSVSVEEMQKTLDGMAGGQVSDEVKTQLRRVKEGKRDQYRFSNGNWDGIIERNEKDRTYIAVWEADLHY
ncbi:MAG TPA: serine/threonine-protein kinase [Halomicronema sp.]